MNQIMETSSKGIIAQTNVQVKNELSFSADLFLEDDGSVTLSLREIDLVENAISEKEALKQMAQAILEYALDFSADFNYWSSAPNRTQHIAYVQTIAELNDMEKIMELIRIITKQYY